MKFAQLNPTLNFFLDDNPKTGAADYQFPLPMRIDGWNFAQNEFSVHTMAEKTATLNLPKGARSIALPDDYGAMGLLYDTGNNQTYTQKELGAGVVRNDDVAQGFQYWVWGGQLFIDTDQASTLKLSYFAYWPSVEYTVNAEGIVALTKDDILVPRWSLQALLHLTAAYCLTPNAIRAAMDRNYDIGPVASGTPIMNSRATQAREHAWWYDHLLSKHPAQVRLVGMND